VIPNKNRTSKIKSSRISFLTMETRRWSILNNELVRFWSSNPNPKISNTSTAKSSQTKWPMREFPCLSSCASKILKTCLSAPLPTTVSPPMTQCQATSSQRFQHRETRVETNCSYRACSAQLSNLKACKIQHSCRFCRTKTKNQYWLRKYTLGQNENKK